MEPMRRYKMMLKTRDPHAFRFARNKIDELKDQETTSRPEPELGPLAQIIRSENNHD